ALDHGMAGGVEMRGRVLVGRIVAAADMAAAPADAQMRPAAAGFQALLTSERARRDVLDAGHMAAPPSHRVTPRLLRLTLERRFRRITEISVQRRHHLRALADRTADALDRAGTHITDRENARHRGLQR